MLGINALSPRTGEFVERNFNFENGKREIYFNRKLNTMHMTVAAIQHCHCLFEGRKNDK